MNMMALETTTGAFDVSTALSGITSALSDFSVSNVSGVIVAGLAIAVPLILIWFGYRFVFKKAKGALKKGA